MQHSERWPSERKREKEAKRLNPKVVILANILQFFATKITPKWSLELYFCPKVVGFTIKWFLKKCIGKAIHKLDAD